MEMGWNVHYSESEEEEDEECKTRGPCITFSSVPSRVAVMGVDGNGNVFIVDVSYHRRSYCSLKIQRFDAVDQKMRYIFDGVTPFQTNYIYICTFKQSSYYNQIVCLSNVDDSIYLYDIDMKDAPKKIAFKQKENITTRSSCCDPYDNFYRCVEYDFNPRYNLRPNPYPIRNFCIEQIQTKDSRCIAQDVLFEFSENHGVPQDPSMIYYQKQHCLVVLCCKVISSRITSYIKVIDIKERKIVSELDIQEKENRHISNICLLFDDTVLALSNKYKCIVHLYSWPTFEFIRNVDFQTLPCSLRRNYSPNHIVFDPVYKVLYTGFKIRSGGNSSIVVRYDFQFIESVKESFLLGDVDIHSFIEEEEDE